MIEVSIVPDPTKTREDQKAAEARNLHAALKLHLRAIFVAFALPYAVLAFLSYFDERVLGIAVFTSLTANERGQVATLVAIGIYLLSVWRGKLHMLGSAISLSSRPVDEERAEVVGIEESTTGSCRQAGLARSLNVAPSLRERARRLRFAAGWTLVLIVIALAGGMAIFVQAGTRAGAEASIPADANNLQIYIVSSLSQRIGAVLLLLFLVQILVSLYRYNIRLAAFLDARADVLDVFLDPDVDVPLRELAELFGPERLDFGRMPATPLQQLSTAIETVSSRAASKPSAPSGNTAG